MNRQEAGFYEAMFSRLEEAELKSQAARQAALWLRSFPSLVTERLFRDSLIAATAALRHERVVTANLRDFRRFAVEVEIY